MDATGEAGQQEPDKDAPPTEEGRYAKYRQEIVNYEREFKRWTDRSKKIWRRYKDERNAYEDQLSRFNLFWSNVQTLAPLIYARVPKPVATRRFHDPDKLGRTAARVLQRMLQFMVSSTEFDEYARCATLDLLIPGRGCGWVRYVPHFRDVEVKGNSPGTNEEVRGEGFQTSNNDEEPEEGETVRVTDYEEAIPDYVNWLDFGHNVSRTYDEVWIVWRRTYLTRDELVERFGEEKGQAVPLDYSPEKTDTEDTPTQVKKATVYEMWDKRNRLACWLSKEMSGGGGLLDEREDPLGLDGFFPCPMPLYATLGNDTLIPTPDYVQYQDQAQELDELTGRIGAIQKAIKAVGVYDASAEAVQRILAEGVENQLIPVDQWAAFAERGGLKGVMEFVPMKEIMETLLGLHEARESVKQIIYEVTGMSDIIRGANDPEETATSTQAKSHFAMIRLVHKQRAVQRFLRDTIRIMAQIACEHFEMETIQRYSGMKLLTDLEKKTTQQQIQQMAQVQQQQGGQPGQAPPPPQIPYDLQELLDEPTWEEVYALLKDDCARNFHIEVETDSTVYEDEQAEKASRMEFLQAASTYIAQAIPAITQTPQIAPLVLQMMMFMVRSYRISSELETCFEQTMRTIEQIAQKAPPPGTNQAENAKVQGQLQLEAQKLQMQMQMEQKKAELDEQTRQREVVQKGQLAQVQQQAQIQEDHAKNQMESQRETIKMHQEAQLRQMEMEHEKQIEMLKMQNQFAIEKMKLEHQSAIKGQEMQQTAALEGAKMQQQGSLERERMQHEAKQAKADGAAEKKESPREIVIRHHHEDGSSGGSAPTKQ